MSTNTILTSSGVEVEVFPYSEFQGIDTSRDRAALDSGEKQSLFIIEDGFADWRGVLVRDPGAVSRNSGDGKISHVNFYGRNEACWAQRDGGGVSLASDRFFSHGPGHKLDEVYPVGSTVTSTVFNHRTIFATAGQPMYRYNGASWKEVINLNPQTPAFLAAVQQRLCVAKANGTLVDLSRVDDETYFTEDEVAGATSVTKGGNIDIRNLLGTSDVIKGLSAFEQNRLAIFTNDQCLIYTLHPDLTKWEIDDRANIQVGTISHNAVARAYSDLLYCSRNGIYSIQRSRTNGVTIFSIPMSFKVEQTYRALLKTVTNQEEISSYFDQDNGQFHTYFPQGPLLTNRLTLTLDPTGENNNKWSTGSFLQATCGRQLGPTTLLGTPGGVWNRKLVEDETDISPTMIVETPILWQGAINDLKDSHSIIIQASGKGTIDIEAFDELDRPLSGMTFEISGLGVDDSFGPVPLSLQYERKFQHRYRGVYFRFKIKGTGLLRMTGFAVTIRSDK